VHLTPQTLSPTPQLFTKAVTTAVISAIGNIFCQLVVEAKPALDGRRVAVFTALGFAWVAPALHTWFALVNRLVPAAGNAGASVWVARAWVAVCWGRSGALMEYRWVV